MARGYVAKLHAHLEELQDPTMLQARLALELGIRANEATAEWVQHAMAEIKTQTEGG